MFDQLPSPSTEQVKASIRSLLEFLQITDKISGAHTVEFYTQDIWRTHVAVSPEAVLSVFSQQHTFQQGCQGIHDLSRIFSEATKQLVDLEAFAEEACHNSLPNMGVCTSFEELNQVFAKGKTKYPDKEIKTDQFMNDKKSHEVVIMSQLVEGIADAYKVKQVIDLGAGKGYLSSYLSMHYNLKVYGIDSSHTNTDGANKRNRKLKKYWKAYKTNARTTSKAQQYDQKKESLLSSNADQGILGNKGSDLTERGTSISNDCGDDGLHLFSDSSKLPVLKDFSDSVPPERNADKLESTFDMCSFLDILPSGAADLPPVSERACKTLSPEEKERRKIENIKAKKRNESNVYSPLTSYVTAETELHDLITDLEDSIMVGLHTCGDLAPNTLRIFAAKPEIKAVCSVGCCYHFLSEEFDSLTEDQTERTWGFPMSQYLKEKGWHIGRNARMSACLALERVVVGQGLPTESLFYRAVLQVICKEVYGITQRSYSILPQSKDVVKTDQRVGKIFSKSSGFTDYVRKSLKKFGQDDSKLSDQEIMGYYEKYKPRRNELEAFNRLKVFLAPCVEALILLDRLCYLREQENIIWSGLVKLFDPVKSPRCYAVVSFKEL